MNHRQHDHALRATREAPGTASPGAYQLHGAALTASVDTVKPNYVPIRRVLTRLSLADIHRPSGIAWRGPEAVDD